MRFFLFSITISLGMVYGQVNLTSSNIPIVKITTPVGQTINDVNRIVCDMGVIDNSSQINLINDPFNGYLGKIAIEIRGSTSQQYPKKSYAFETQTVLGANLNVPLMGLPAENDWVLNGPYPDKTLLRDAITFDLSRKMGHYASRFRFCELLINNEYKGVYILFERIKRDHERVNIAHLDLDDLAGDSLTGGYIFKVDKLTGEVGTTWNSNFNNEVVFQFHDPEFDELQPAQISYLQNFVSDFENSIQSDPEANYNNFIEPTSFYDFFILQELGRTVDGYRSSAFMYKDKNSGDFNGKIVAGPMWDFNLSYGNADYCDAQITTGWQYNFDEICNFSSAIPFWWERLLDSPSYRNGLKCRWNELRQGILHTDSLHHWIDSMAFMLNESRIRNFEQWPIIGVYVNWNGFVGNTYEEDLDFFKTYIAERAQWIDLNLPGICNVGVETNSLEQEIDVYPNPSKDILYIGSNETIQTIEILDQTGNLLERISLENNNSKTIQIPVEYLDSGVYFIRISINNDKIISKRFIKI